MILEQLYAKFLAQGAYFISSQGEAVLINPLREVKSYLDLAKENKSTITYIYSIHFHADLVSGQVDLAKATRTTVVLEPHVEGEFATSHNEVYSNSTELDAAKTYHVPCGGGYGSLIYTSIARSKRIDMAILKR